MSRFRNKLRAARVEGLYRIPEAELQARREAVVKEMQRLAGGGGGEGKAPRVLFIDSDHPAIRGESFLSSIRAMLQEGGARVVVVDSYADVEARVAAAGRVFYCDTTTGRMRSDVENRSNVPKHSRPPVFFGIDLAAPEPTIGPLDVMQMEQAREEAAKPANQMRALRRNVLGKKGRW